MADGGALLHVASICDCYYAIYMSESCLELVEVAVQVAESFGVDLWRLHMEINAMTDVGRHICIKFGCRRIKGFYDSWDGRITSRGTRDTLRKSMVKSVPRHPLAHINVL